MANSVIIGVEGDAGLYMVNLDTRTVEPVGTEQAAMLRVNGGDKPLINGVNLALRIGEAPALSAGHNEAH